MAAQPDRPDPSQLARPTNRQEFNRLVYRIVRSIPTGRVMTYGQIASCIPTPRSIDPLAYRRIRARWVGYALAQCPEDVPWHRVINQQGRISQRPSGSHHLQLELLKQEGTPLTRDAVDLALAEWAPTILDLAQSAENDDPAGAESEEG